MVNLRRSNVIKRIGIAGAAGSGKTTAASYLVKEHGFTLLGFATPLYKLGDIHSTNPEEWHSRVFGWGLDYLEPLGHSLNTILNFTHDCLDVMNDIPVIEGKNRTLLQTLGTEVGRALDENLWTNIFEARVEELGPDAKIVNDNLRFPNEFESLQRLNFYNVYLETPDEVRSKRYEQEYGIPMNESQLSHASEAYLDDIKDKCDIVYHNIGRIEDIYQYIDDVINEKAFKLSKNPWILTEVTSDGWKVKDKEV